MYDFVMRAQLTRDIFTRVDVTSLILYTARHSCRAWVADWITVAVSIRIIAGNHTFEFCSIHQPCSSIKTRRLVYSSASLQYLVDQAYAGNPTISEPKPCIKSSIFSSYHHHCASTCCWRTDCNIIKKWICEVKDCSWACYFSVACAATSAPRTQTRTRDTRVSRGKRSVHACAAADN